MNSVLDENTLMHQQMMGEGIAGSLFKLRSGSWDELAARAYIKQVLWASQRARSTEQEYASEVFARFEERMGDSYLYTQHEDGRSGSLLVESCATILDKPEIEPQDLVNVLHMLERHPNVKLGMLIQSKALHSYALDLEPNLGWLNPPGED